MGRQTVAVGDLVKVWIRREEYEVFDRLKKDFAVFFGRAWNEAMVGAGEPFSHHRDWNAFLAVASLREHREVLAPLTRRLRAQGRRLYNTIIG